MGRAETSKETMCYTGITTWQFLVDLRVSVCFSIRQGQLSLTD